VVLHVAVEEAQARADFKVQMPDAETGEFAVEPIGDIGQDQNPAHNRELSPVTEFEYGVNKFWRAELELEQYRAPGPPRGDAVPLSLGDAHCPRHAGRAGLPACPPAFSNTARPVDRMTTASARSCSLEPHYRTRHPQLQWRHFIRDKIRSPPRDIWRWQAEYEIHF
jgi:hypothetical protein